MFEGWGEYYLMIGSAGAVLIGLLFVVVTLTSEQERSTMLIGTSLYMSPIVLHCALVLVVSAAALAPVLEHAEVGLLCAAVAVIGIVTSVRVTRGILRGPMSPPPHWSDVWCYGVAPGICYLALAAVSEGLLTQAGWSALILAATMLAILLVCIRNAWDLVTWLAPKSDTALTAGETGQDR